MIKNANNIFKLITQGVYVISVNNGKQQNAFTAAWVMQVSFNPMLICFSINPHHYSYKLLSEGDVCCISVLNEQQQAIADHFGQSTNDKMAAYKWLKTETGSGALVESLAYFDCKVDHYSDAGDHKLVICEVIDAALLNPGQPLLYSITGDMDNSSELYKQ